MSPEGSGLICGLLGGDKPFPIYVMGMQIPALQAEHQRDYMYKYVQQQVLKCVKIMSAIASVLSSNPSFHAAPSIRNLNPPCSHDFLLPAE